MSEWRVAPLREIADIRVSNVDKKATLGEAPVRLCNYMDVYANDYIRADLPFMEATATAAEIQRFGVQQGDVMITKDSETPDDIGIPAVVMDQIEGLVCGYHLAQIRPNRSLVDPVYLTKQLALPETAAYFAQRAAGSTRYGLSNRTISNVPIRLAPLAQQRGVAEVLSRLDDSIERSDALIKKHQQIKAGLMLDLFTRGLLPDGRLRPEPSVSSTLYVHSNAGCIPKAWQASTLQAQINPARPIVYGILMPGYGFAGGVPVVKVKDIRDRRIGVDGLLLTSPQIDYEYRRSRLRSGDVLFTIRGTVGRVALVPPELDSANITQDTARIDLLNSSKRFLSYFLETPMARRFFEVNTLGVAVQSINLGELRKLPLPIPPLDEQERIADRMDAVCDRLDADLAALSKLRAQKLGLMQDLLTGKVRVLLAEPVPA